MTSCDPEESADDETGYFVSSSGNDEDGAGTRASPWRTIGLAIERAQATGRANVYIEPGRYDEALTLTDSDPGIHVSGGWTVNTDESPPVWIRDCTAGSRDLTRIVSDEPIGFDAANVVHEAGLSHLTLEANPAASNAAQNQPGQSNIGLLVRGDASLFFLRNVRIVTADAGDAGPADVGFDGAGPTSCQPGIGCVNPGGTRDGDNGADAVAPEEEIGQFDETGYRPALGDIGAPGQPGLNGWPGGVGETRTDCLRCNGLACEEHTVSGPEGYCGCGGEPGVGGLPGRGGGASVGVVVTGMDANISIEASLVITGDGGTGAEGGLGGLGADGNEGSDAYAAHCATECNVSGTTCSSGQSETVAGGTAGGPGGRGGNGGKGSPGIGGPSIGVAVAGGASVSLDAATSFELGNPGLGGDGMTPGLTAEVYEQE